MTEAQIEYAWNPIEDLPIDWSSFSRPDLDDALQAWKDEQYTLRDRSKVTRLEQQLARRWAIETGLIERLYTMDRGTTETLIKLGLDTLTKFSSTGSVRPEVLQLIEDQQAALEFLFEYVKEERPLTASYIKELHQALCKNQPTSEAIDQFGKKVNVPLLKGKWKRSPNNPMRHDGSIHEYCPPEFVQDEIAQLIAMHDEHCRQNVRPEVEAAWLHHRFTQIHPFQDGNGRVARTLATLVFLKAGFLALVVRKEEHGEKYLDALEAADRGQLEPLVTLFANIQASDLEDAITFVRDMRGQGVAALAAAAAQTAKRREVDQEREMSDLTDRLVDIGLRRMEEVATELNKAFTNVGLTPDISAWANDETSATWWHVQIVNAAREYGYFAELGRFRRCVQIRIRLNTVSSPQTHLVVSFHHKGLRVGTMAAVAFLTTNEAGLEEARPLTFGSNNEFTYSLSLKNLDDEFRLWLDGVLTNLLDVWQARL